MARKKVSLERIANDANRRATFRKRSKGLMKKAGELVTLCDVKACVVVYGDGGEAQAQAPGIWPSATEATLLLSRFKATPDLDQYKKTVNQEDFLRQRVAKLQEQVHKSERETHERATNALLLEALIGRLPGNIAAEELTSLNQAVEMRFNNQPTALLESPTDQMMAT